MKSLLVFTPYYPPHVGGLESHAQQFNEYIIQAGWRVTVFTSDIPKTSFSVSHNHCVIRFPAFELISGYPVPKFWLPRFWKHWRLIHQFLQPTSYPLQPAIIISRTRFFLTSLMAFYFSKRHNIPWVHIEHGADHTKLRGFFLPFIAWLYDYTLGRFTLRMADQVIANSYATAQFVNLFTPRHISVIYRGVDQARIDSIVPEVALRKTHADSIIVTYVGRLMIGKGVQELINAVSILSDLDIQLIIVGDGPHKNRLAKLGEKHHLRDSVHFLGETPWKKTIALIKASDIVVNPSYTEGLPSSIIEAALCRRAIIATNVGGTPEIVRHGIEALLVPSKDPGSLAKALQRLAKNPKLREKLGNQAYIRAVALFTWPQAIEKYRIIFNNLFDD